MKDHLKSLIVKLYDNEFNCIHLNAKKNYLEILANFSKNKHIYFFKYIESNKIDKIKYSAVLVRNSKTLLNINSFSLDKTLYVTIKAIDNINTHF
jgi:hypothetical protein